MELFTLQVILHRGEWLGRHEKPLFLRSSAGSTAASQGGRAVSVGASVLVMARKFDSPGQRRTRGCSELERTRTRGQSKTGKIVAPGIWMLLPIPADRAARGRARG